MRLIKLKNEHYIIVADSEIKEDDWYYWEITKTIQIAKLDSLNRLPKNSDGSKKITHSTQPLEDVGLGKYDLRFNKIFALYLDEIKELTGEVDVEKDYVLSRLCVYDKRNPDYIPYDEDDKSRKPTDCGCDNCFYGRTILSEKILQLNQALEDNKDKKYTEEDLRIALVYGYERGREGDFTSEQEEEFYKYLQPKTEWEVEIVNGKFKLK